jgi:cytochrome P450
MNAIPQLVTWVLQKAGPRRTRTTERNQHPLPPSAPLPSILQTLSFWRDPHGYLGWCQRRYGNTFTIDPVGSPPLVFMSKPADIRAIVSAPADVLHPGEGGLAIAPLVGSESFMLAEENEHLEGRRSTLPAFHQKVVHKHVKMVQEIAMQEISAWPLGRPVAIHPYLRSLTLRIILQMIFGSEDNRILELHTRLLSMFSVTASLVLQEPQLCHLPAWRSIWKAFLTERTAVNELIMGLIKDEPHAGARDGGLLGLLCAGRDTTIGDADPWQIRNDLMSIILAGHETTASELAWALQLLAHNPAVRDQLVDDLDDGEQYLTATIQEVLRHRPVFLFAIPRVVHEPFEIAGTTYHPNVHLVGCIHLMHHDPHLYPEPDKFRPERFIGASPQTELWSPWGGGRKRCPGHHLAMLEMRTTLRAILSTLKIEPVGRRVETARWRSVIVTPGRGARIIAYKR